MERFFNDQHDLGHSCPRNLFYCRSFITEGLIQSVGPTRAALLNVFLIIFLRVLPLFIRRCLSRSDNVDPLESLRKEIALRLKQYGENKALLYSIEELISKKHLEELIASSQEFI